MQHRFYIKNCISCDHIIMNDLQIVVKDNILHLKKKNNKSICICTV